MSYRCPDCGGSHHELLPGPPRKSKNYQLCQYWLRIHGPCGEQTVFDCTVCPKASTPELSEAEQARRDTWFKMHFGCDLLILRREGEVFVGECWRGPGTRMEPKPCCFEDCLLMKGEGSE